MTFFNKACMNLSECEIFVKTSYWTPDFFEGSAFLKYSSFMTECAEQLLISYTNSKVLKITQWKKKLQGEGILRPFFAEIILLKTKQKPSSCQLGISLQILIRSCFFFTSKSSKEKKELNSLTCLNCSSKLQFCWDEKFCWVWDTGELLCWEEGVVGWLGGLAGGMGENVVCGGMGKPNTEADVKGILPWPPRPAKRFCELARKSAACRCLLKASKAGRGGKLAKIVRGSNCSFSSESSFIKCRVS